MHHAIPQLIRWLLTGAVLALAMPAAAGGLPDRLFAATACPEPVARIARCYSTQDASGAWLLAAVPHDWNRRLIVHAHGGPRLGAPADGDSLGDLERYASMLGAGYAWIGSTYRRGGYGVRRAAADVDNSRRMFADAWGRPERTLLHGQSWGGNVAAKVAELHALDLDGNRNFDAVLITNGLLTGGTRAYGFRADLRAVYQYVCRNHPAPDEPQYPLWQGLPEQARMTRAELRARVHACTGIDDRPSARSPEQQARLSDILAVTGVAESQLVAHLAWGTFHFRDLVQRHLDGGNPFDNTGTVYRGSRDDEALNAGVQRFAADPAAVARLAYDADLSGQIVLPLLAVHAAHDPVVSPRSLAAYAKTVGAAGGSELFAAVMTDESDHSRLRDATYLAALDALETWLDSGIRPGQATLQELCLVRAAAPDDCRFLAR